MNKLNSEGHDESQYLPRGTPPINPFRAQHDEVVWDGLSIRSVKWLPDRLYARQKLEKAHVDTAVTFYKAMVQTQQALGISDIRAKLSEGDLQSGNPKDLFFATMQQLAKPESNILLWLVNDNYNRGNIELAIHVIGTIHHALENTQLIVDKLANAGKLSNIPALELRPEFDPV